jgi:large subunit ribosomal protein L29
VTKVDELRGFPNEEILSRLDEAKEELFNLRFQNATGQLENYKQMGLLKKEIARLETIVRERELGIEMAPKPAESAGKKRRWRKTKTDEEVDASMQARAEGTEEEELETEEELGTEEVDDELQEEGKQ